MKKTGVFLLGFILLGCQTIEQNTDSGVDTEIVEIEEADLAQYWIRNTNKIKRSKGRPDWLPKGKGEWTVLTVIDSNGLVVERILVSSKPKGFMTQSMLDKMPRSHFTPSSANVNRTPVRYLETSKIVLRSELSNMKAQGKNKRHQ